MDPKIFRAYDIRGIYPDQLNEGDVYMIVQAYIQVVKPRKVVLAKDVRESGPILFEAAKNGFINAGVDVINIGTVSTDMFYYAVGTLAVDGGITLSASHNPREWNGLNMAKKKAEPISSETGLLEIKKIALKGKKISADKKGKIIKKNLWDDFAQYVLSYINPKNLQPVKIVANANFGMQVRVLNHIIKKGKLPIRVVPLNGEPDGTFPKGRPDPLISENRREIIDLVKKEKADLGVSWDADGDRCFLVDEKGNFQEGYFTTAILAAEILKKHPGGKIIIDPRLIWASMEMIKKNGGISIISRPGMTLIAGRMKKEKAVFGGEMSAHYYFKENFYRDNGMIPLFLVLEMMAKYNKKLSEFYEPLTKKYFVSGEINSEVEDKEGVLREAEEKYKDGKIEHIDGFSVEYKSWRFNLRPSNTENLLRLNVESTKKELMQQKRDEILKLIEEYK